MLPINAMPHLSEIYFDSRYFSSAFLSVVVWYASRLYCHKWCPPANMPNGPKGRPKDCRNLPEVCHGSVSAWGSRFGGEGLCCRLGYNIPQPLGTGIAPACIHTLLLVCDSDNSYPAS